MLKRLFSWLLGALGVGGGVYVFILVALYLLQGKLLFLPSSVPVDVVTQMAAENGAQPHRIEASDGTRLQVWHYPAQGQRVVLYAHGNAGSLADALPLKRALQQAGWDVLAVGYRGYPGSQGSPTERGLRLDVRAAYEYTTDELGFSADRVVLHGRSLGGGVVGTLMLDVPVAGVALQSTFTGAVDVAAELYPFVPVRLLMTNPFRTADRAPQFQGPVWIVHSDADEVIPVHHGRQLAEQFPQAEYIEIKGYGHNEHALVADEDARRSYFAFLERIVPSIEPKGQD